MTARRLCVIAGLATTMLHCHEPLTESSDAPAELDVESRATDSDVAPDDLAELDPDFDPDLDGVEAEQIAELQAPPELQLGPPPTCTERPRLKVLFIGNSFTIGHDIPGLVAQLAARAGIEIDTRTMAHAGKNLAWHYERPKTARVIARGGWDLVVLQSRSMDTLRDPDGFLAAGQGLAELARAAGATPVLFETWARKEGHPVYGKRRLTGGDPDTMQDKVRDNYRRLAEATGADVAEVGEAWRALRHGTPDIDPYTSDDNHANRRGAYLTANVLFAKITDVNPVGNVGDPLLRLDPETAQTLQTYAAEVVAPRCAVP
jgi:hypothetical protein